MKITSVRSMMVLAIASLVTLARLGLLAMTKSREDDRQTSLNEVLGKMAKVDDK